MSAEAVNGTQPHMPDETLVRLADGELPAQDAQRARRHLRQCPECSARMARFEQVSSDLLSAHRVDSRAMRAAKTCASVVMALCCLYWIAGIGAARPELTIAGLQLSVLPVTYLTPGATRPVTAAEICGHADDADERAISPSIQHLVLRNYGVRGLSERDYELDYLITPELGGAPDPQNLWPERYASATWNAHVKDDLEQLLRRLVCNGSVPLAAAQRDIATNWIAAYKHYFHADKPGGWAATLPQPVPQRE